MKTLGRYRLDRVLGRGAFATVWLARDPALDASVAIKVLAENWSHDADARERFLTESRLLRRIDHPSVVRVHDVGEADGRPYAVMELIEGGTLDDHADGTLHPYEAMRLIGEVARAVQVLHDGGIVHRDIKPSNILLRPDPSGETVGRVVVSDLGSAKALAEASGYTVTTGTPAYMAPEVALGQHIDGRADVYAIAAVCHEVVLGEKIFEADSISAVARRDAAAPAVDVADRVGMPPALDDLRRCLDPDPDVRPDDPAELAQACERLAAGEETHGLRRVGTEWPAPLVLGGATLLGLGSAALTWWLLR